MSMMVLVPQQKEPKLRYVTFYVFISCPSSHLYLSFLSYHLFHFFSLYVSFLSSLFYASFLFVILQRLIGLLNFVGQFILRKMSFIQLLVNLFILYLYREILLYFPSTCYSQFFTLYFPIFSLFFLFCVFLLCDPSSTSFIFSLSFICFLSFRVCASFLSFCYHWKFYFDQQLMKLNDQLLFSFPIC